MGRALILETTFLVDLEREERRREPGHAIAFLEREPDTRLYLPFTVAGELAGGLSALAYDMPLLTRNVDHFRRVPGLDVETY